MIPKRIPGPAELLGRGRMWALAAADRRKMLPWGDAALTFMRPVLPFPGVSQASRSLLDHAALVARADMVLAGRFPLLGVPDGISWGTSPNWFLDPLSGREAPLVHFSRVPYLNESLVGDHKITWELNRHQWMVWLAIAARLTGEQEYAQAIWRHLSDWLQKNPRGLGMNWASSLEVAFRAIAWTWTLHLLDEQPPEPLAGQLTNALHAHGLLIERWLSTWFSPNTHLTGEALGLLYLGTGFPSLPHATAWKNKGWRILCEQATRQLRPDGTYFEQTGWYQAYTTDFYLHALALAKSAGLEVPGVVVQRVHASARALRGMTHRDGVVVRWGDDDGGRLMPFAANSYGDVRDTLALAAVTFDDATILPTSGTAKAGAVDSVIWLQGEAGVTALRELEAAQSASARSVVFPDGGWVALRSRRLEVFMDAGEHARLSGAHAHADALALEIAVDGRAVLADPGTYRYLGPCRDEFRATAAHSALVVGNRSSAQPAGPFRWSEVAHAELGAVYLNSSMQVISAVHDGYAACAREGSGRVYRDLVMLPGEALLVIDRAMGRFVEPVAVHWRPPRGVTVEFQSDRVLLKSAGESRAAPATAPGGATLATIVISQDWTISSSVAGHSSGYAARTEVVGVRVTQPLDAAHDVMLLTLLVPGEAGSDVAVQPLAGAAPGWQVSLADDEVTVFTETAEFADVRVSASLTVVLGSLANPTRLCIVSARALAIGGEPVEVVSDASPERAVLMFERHAGAWRMLPS